MSNKNWRERAQETLAQIAKLEEANSIEDVATEIASLLLNDPSAAGLYFEDKKYQHLPLNLLKPLINHHLNHKTPYSNQVIYSIMGLQYVPTEIVDMLVIQKKVFAYRRTALIDQLPTSENALLALAEEGNENLISFIASHADATANVLLKLWEEHPSSRTDCIRNRNMPTREATLWLYDMRCLAKPEPLWFRFKDWYSKTPGWREALIEWLTPKMEDVDFTKLPVEWLEETAAMLADTHNGDEIIIE